MLRQRGFVPICLKDWVDQVTHILQQHKEQKGDEHSKKDLKQLLMSNLINLANFNKKARISIILRAKKTSTLQIVNIKQVSRKKLGVLGNYKVIESNEKQERNFKSQKVIQDSLLQSQSLSESSNEENDETIEDQKTSYNHQSQNKYVSSLDRLIPYLQIQKLKKGEFLYNYRDECHSVYIILRGNISVWKKKDDTTLTEEIELNRKHKQIKQFIVNSSNIVEEARLKKELEQIEKQLDAMRNLEEQQVFLNQKPKIDLNSQHPQVNTQMLYSRDDNIISTDKIQYKLYQKMLQQKYFAVNNVCRFYKESLKSTGIIIGESNCISQFKMDEAHIVDSEEAVLLQIDSNAFNRIFDLQIQKIQFLNQVLKSQFPHATKESINWLALASQERYCHSYQTIFQEGERADAFYILRTGSVQILNKQCYQQQACELAISTRKCKQLEVTQIQEGGIFGIEDLHPQKRRNYSAISTAIPFSHIYCITRRMLDQAIADNSDFPLEKDIKKLCKIKNDWMKERTDQLIEYSNEKVIESTRSKSGSFNTIVKRIIKQTSESKSNFSDDRSFGGGDRRSSNNSTDSQGLSMRRRSRKKSTLNPDKLEEQIQQFHKQQQQGSHNNMSTMQSDQEISFDLEPHSADIQTQQLSLFNKKSTLIRNFVSEKEIDPRNKAIINMNHKYDEQIDKKQNIQYKLQTNSLKNLMSAAEARKEEIKHKREQEMVKRNASKRRTARTLENFFASPTKPLAIPQKMEEEKKKVEEYEAVLNSSIEKGNEHLIYPLTSECYEKQSRIKQNESEKQNYIKSQNMTKQENYYIRQYQKKMEGRPKNQKFFDHIKISQSAYLNKTQSQNDIISIIDQNNLTQVQSNHSLTQKKMSLASASANLISSCRSLYMGGGTGKQMQKQRIQMILQPAKLNNTLINSSLEIPSQRNMQESKLKEKKQIHIRIGGKQVSYIQNDFSTPQHKKSQISNTTSTSIGSQNKLSPLKNFKSTRREVFKQISKQSPILQDSSLERSIDQQNTTTKKASIFSNCRNQQHLLIKNFYTFDDQNSFEQ